ncbi:Zinc finger CCCH domain-containing protein 18 [Bienertia sinuspersici]
MMDISESIKIVRDRIQAIEPQHASKIVGYLLQNYGDEDMIRLAFSPDNVIENETYKVLQTKWLTNFYMSPSLGNSPIQYGTPHQSFTDPRPCLTSNNVLLKACSKVIEEQFQRSLKIENDYIDSELYNNTNYTNYLDHQPAFTDFRSNRFCRRSIEFPPKVCHYFNKGYCKHGNNCKFLHGLGSDARGYENGDDDHNVFSLGSLDKLEIDLIELLRSRKGDPIPIASLPMTYYNKFHRTIQAEGYLTESQRQGKVAGCSLTRLLGRLKTSIRVIERPDGQRSVILAQDAAKYCHARIEQGGFIPESRQIYLTFPPESVFTEIDVSDYFTKYGPVQDVRIPSQDKRMFGFVIFVEPSTTKIVLKKGNPHYICGARVLVKPYREKPRLSDR